MPNSLTIKGSILRIRFENNNGFVIAVMKDHATSKEIVIKGTMPRISPGLNVRATGYWENHERWGPQFVVQQHEIIEPDTLEGIKSFLSSKLIKGIGPVMADRIVSHFGDDTLRIIKEEPRRLLDVPGVSEGRLKDVIESYEKNRQYEEVAIILGKHGISENLCIKVVDHFKDKALNVVRTDPYKLTKIDGIGFLTADKVALAAGLSPYEPERLYSAVEHTLQEALVKEGHLYLLFEDLVERTFKNLESTARPVDRDLVANAVVECIEGGRLINDDSSPGQTPVYLRHYYELENNAATELIRIVNGVVPKIANPEPLIKEIEARLNINLSAQQQEALLQLAEASCLVVSGGPGTGKTTLIKSALQLLGSTTTSERMLLAAPTGKAAKRMAESTGHAAQTVHRLLKFNPMFGFQQNKDSPLEADVVIIDEASMLDISLFYRLLQAVPTGCRLVLVGDIDQLPSVGPGSVLRDVIESGVLPVVYLRAVFRQAEASNIIVNAHRINNGEMIKVDAEKKDFFMFSQDDNELVAGMVKDTVLGLIKKHNYDLMDIQVLTPLWRTSTGVNNLNSVLQAALNPPAQNKAEVAYGEQIFRVGDRVIQYKNDYDKAIFNGDLGLINAVISGDSPADDKVVVDFEGRHITYKRSEMDQLGLAYAMTIHRSQGSEWPVVIVVLTTQHFIMLARNLLYTAITRASEKLVLIGSKQAAAMAIRNDAVAHRNSKLKERLQALKEDFAALAHTG